MVRPTENGPKEASGTPWCPRGGRRGREAPREKNPGKRTRARDLAIVSLDRGLTHRRKLKDSGGSTGEDCSEGRYCLIADLPRLKDAVAGEISAAVVVPPFQYREYYEVRRNVCLLAGPVVGGQIQFRGNRQKNHDGTQGFPLGIGALGGG